MTLASLKFKIQNSKFKNRKIENQTIALKRKHKIKLPDAVIAATALCQQAVLVTRNFHDFQDIAELKLENPFGDE